ncbi:MAG TPA: hypothetical protein VJA40_06155 [archaeon]|nr:hypothetical protein [archaeon]
MAFYVEYSNKARKEHNSLENVVKERVTSEIEGLRNNPFPHGVERVISYTDIKAFRVRIGNY